MSHQNEHHTGSLKRSEPVFLAVGHLQRAHGLDGEIAMKVLTDFPERLSTEKIVYVGEVHKAMMIASIRWKQDLMLIRFKGVTDRDTAAVLTNENVFVCADTLPTLPEGEYYHHELLGLQVYDNKILLGEISDILITGANDVYVISLLNRQELLLPAIKSVIMEVDLKNLKMQVTIPEGL